MYLVLVTIGRRGPKKFQDVIQNHFYVGDTVCYSEKNNAQKLQDFGKSPLVVLDFCHDDKGLILYTLTGDEQFGKKLEIKTSAEHMALSLTNDKRTIADDYVKGNFIVGQCVVVDNLVKDNNVLQNDVLEDDDEVNDHLDARGIIIGIRYEEEVIYRIKVTHVLRGDIWMVLDFYDGENFYDVFTEAIVPQLKFSSFQDEDSTKNLEDTVGNRGCKRESPENGDGNEIRKKTFQTGIATFFKPANAPAIPKKAGRPRKKVRIPKKKPVLVEAKFKLLSQTQIGFNSSSILSETEKLQDMGLCAKYVASPTVSTKTVSRLNWNVEPNRSNLKKLVAMYLEYPMIYTINKFCRDHGISKGVFQPFVHPDVTKRKSVDDITGPGPVPMLSYDQTQVIIDATAARDLLNNGTGKSLIVENVMTIKPDISRTQARNAVNRLLVKCNTAQNVLTGYVKTQSTTSDRNAAITQTSQIAWFDLVSSGCQKAIEFSIRDGGASELGRTYADPKTQSFFVVNLDEEGARGDQGKISVIGYKGKKKHEMIRGDFKDGITILRGGRPVGDKMGNFYLLKGMFHVGLNK